MKTFVLIYQENSDGRCDADIDLFLDRAQAQASMHDAYNKTIEVK